MSFKVFWTASAKGDLRKIIGVVSNDKFTEIVEAPLGIVFLEQFQFDEYRVDCRRIIVGNYKLLYQFKDNVIIVVRVFNTRQDPNKSLK
ncbi:type II toxin-antitoxin system RelE/ParE family toxin [Flavobacterium sp. ZT3R18]|uniref:type II toxin-antitoxin system RelE/ParE family toxin n=1 Tax=Flavobacterium sp. ZT3R18 TaxID=2594429 RepID=UPI00117BA3F4|nr:type II toxin-antitoxin system RelE/ParE family toxin [Flavobacterium sp. ZT3R18]TRX34130.1 type II toxin-antitoxin system RelE/ParE family toxin [Flavobacterium sp. ZT3R18]